MKISSGFSDLIYRIGKSTTHPVKSAFQKNYIPTHQTGCRIPVNLKHQVNNVRQKLMDQKHIENKTVVLIKKNYLPNCYCNNR